MAGDGIQLGLSEAERHTDTSQRDREFELLDLRWDLLPGVFAPHNSRSTAAYTSWLPIPAQGRVLEMGCGAGVTAVYAALRGAGSVVAADIAAAAVENTRVNAARHGVADRVRAVRSDMFAEIGEDERFDLIFWNSSAIPAPEDFVYTRDIEWSLFDRDYASHRAYLREAPRRLTEGGRLFLGFNTNGDVERLHRLCAEAGLRAVEARSMTTTYNDGATTTRFMLLELLPAGRGG
ncbi:methyltransferase [Streptomonospora sp. S1-112]|uniref:Methyltransferase n=1 Tax=Streptomonospora mangrovi TaxID=2883123 RepID=A0A9X3NQ10_9ACTN|nr:methyltransferase [Streptomonospora mangrovi]MDA0567769.1 methyltransferase [Streptomonospora mangrovi]